MRSVYRALLLMSLVSCQAWAQNQSANAAPSAQEEIKSLEREHERNLAILNGESSGLPRGIPTVTYISWSEMHLGE
jgi:hypothetical protein